MGSRMYKVLKIILECEDGVITRQGIVEKLKEQDVEINLKTVSSIVKCINDFFYDYIGDDLIVLIKKKGLTVNKEFFDDGQLQFLLDSVMYHHGLKGSDKDKIKKKLFAFSSLKQQERLSIHVEDDKDMDYSILLNLSTIIKAIENNKKISFRYVSYIVVNNKLQEVISDKNHSYILSPYEIRIDDNHYYLVGYNESRKNELSIYRIDRMRFVQTTNQSSTDIREQYDMDDLLKKSMNMYVSDKVDKLVIECKESILREVVSKFGLNNKAKRLYDKRYLVEIEDVSISKGLIGWILMLRNNIKVVYPLSLKDDIKDILDNMQELYKD